MLLEGHKTVSITISLDEEGHGVTTAVSQVIPRRPAGGFMENQQIGNPIGPSTTEKAEGIW